MLTAPSLVLLLAGAAAATNSTFVFKVDMNVQGVRASRNQDNVLIPCQSNVCVPSGGASFEFCRTACNSEAGQADCASKCTCNGTKPGFMCAGVCNAAKTADECGSPVFQKCIGQDLVCDRTPPSPAPSPSATPAPSASPTHAPTPSPSSSPNPSPSPSSNPSPSPSPSSNPSPSPSPSPLPSPSPSPSSSPSPAPTQRVRFVKLQSPGEAHLIEYYTGMYFGAGQNNANDAFDWDQSIGSIRSVSGNACLDAFVADDKKLYLHTYPCDAANPNQWWIYDDGARQVRHKTHTNMCLDADPSDADKKVQMYTCAQGNAHQYFEMRPILSRGQ